MSNGDRFCIDNVWFWVAINSMFTRRTLVPVEKLVGSVRKIMTEARLLNVLDQGRTFRSIGRNDEGYKMTSKMKEILKWRRD